MTGIFLAAHNLSLGRGDRKGAARLALVFFFFWFGHWFLTNSHVPTQDEYHQLMTGLAWSLYGSATMWMVYIALEPYVRRYWPEILISWNRLLSGRFRDPLVGRDLMVGILGGACFAMLEHLEYVAPSWFGWTVSNVPHGGGTYLLSSGSEYAAYLLFVIPWGFKMALLTIVLPLLLLRRILRLPALAAFAYVTYHVVLFSDGTILGCVLYGLSFSLVVFVVTRFGLLAMAIFWFARNLLAADVPLTPHLSSWYFNDGLLMLAVIFLVATYGFLVATRYRPLFPATLSAESP
jgi:serine/threonine-protein kinase